MRNTNEVLTNSSLQGHIDSFVIENVEKGDEGNYICKVIVVAATLRDSIDLQVIPAQTSSSSMSMSHSISAPSPSPYMSSDNIPVTTPTDNEATTMSSDGPSSTVIVVASISSGLALLILLAITFLIWFFCGEKMQQKHD